MAKRIFNWRLLVLSLIVLLVTGFSIRSSADSDPKFTLLVAQSLLDNGRLYLDDYDDELILGQTIQEHLLNGSIVESRGHFYSYFPPGPSILTVPIVAVAKMIGWDMGDSYNNFSLQRPLAALSSVIVLWIIYFIARAYLKESESLVIAGITVLGSTLVSTLGSALWSINFTTIFIGLSLLLLVRFDTGKAKSSRPILLGLLLFLAFFTRPSAAAFIIPVLIYLFWKDRRQFLIVSVTSFALLVAFLGWTYLEFGSWLPIYYSTARLQAERTPFWIAVYGLLFSPSRGIFVFSPFFLLLIPGLLLMSRRLYRQPLFWLCLGWIGILIFSAARAASWWGGLTFGPRILTEMVLALVLLTIFAWYQARDSLNEKWKRAIVIGFVLLGLMGITIHSFQGLYNQSTGYWDNLIEYVPQPPFEGLGDLFNWRYAQFLATRGMLCTIEADHMTEIIKFDRTLTDYKYGSPIPFNGDSISNFRLAAKLEAIYRETEGNLQHSSPGEYDPIPGDFASYLPNISHQWPFKGNSSLFVGWSAINDAEPFRWSLCDNARVIFRLGSDETSGKSHVLILQAGAYGPQEVTINLNGATIGDWTFTGPATSPQTAVLPFDGSLLIPGKLNEIEIEIPDARFSGIKDQRWLGLAFRELAILPAGDYPPSPPTATTPTPYP